MSHSIFLTGGTGYVGSRLIPRLIGRNMKKSLVFSIIISVLLGQEQLAPAATL